LQKLVEQVAVRAVDLDAVKAGRFGVLGAVAKSLDDFRNFLGLQRARRDIRPLRANQAHMPLGGERAWRNRQRPVLVDRIGDAPDMPELEEHAPAGAMHALHDFAPTLDLLVGPNAGGVRIADAGGGDRRRLGNDQAGGRALRVIFAHHRIRNASWAGRSIARQGREDNAVGKFQIADLQRVKQGGH
jgi:hypothetical protein